MTETRLRGQEVAIRLSRGNEFESTITAIRDFTLQLDLTALEEGYLGEVTMRKDDIFNGVSGSFTVDAEGQDLFLLLQAIKERAQRRLPVNNTRINATGRFAFPNGEAPLVLVKDMKFDSIPISVPGRAEYVNAAFSYKAEDAVFITT